MKNKKIKPKKFITIYEQIQLLKERGLKIEEPKRLEYYIKKYNYQNFINGYNTPFLSGQRRSNNKYNPGSSSNLIIELFNFDRNISSLILSNIQNVERIFNSGIIYCVGKKIQSIGYEFGEIQKINNGDKKLIYNHKETENYELKDKDPIKTIFKKVVDQNKNNKLFKKYENNYDEIPIWSLFLYFSFGDSINFFKKLTKELKLEILNFCFETKFNSNVDVFETIMTMLKNIRNRICHNNVLYDYVLSKEDKIVKHFLVNNNISDNKKIKIYDAIKIIDFLVGNKTKATSILDKFSEKIDKYFKNNKNKFPNDISSFIFKSMNYNF